MDNQRLLLFLVLAAIIMMLWQAWEAENRPAPVATEAPAKTPSVAEQSVPQAPASASPSKQTPELAPVLSKAQRIAVKTDLFSAIIDTHGGDLRELDLLKHPVAADKPNEPFRLLRDDQEHLYIAQSGIIGKGKHYPNHNTRYRAEQQSYQLSEGEKTVDVVLHWQAPDGVRYEKIIRFTRGSYLIDISYRVHNRTNNPWKGFMYSQFQHQLVESKGGLFMLPTYTGGAIYTPEEHYEKIKFGDMQDQDLARKSSGGWIAVLQHYFVGAWLPPQDKPNQLYTRKLSDELFSLGYKNLEPVTVAARSEGTLSAQLYLGPKEQKRLKQLPEGMDLTVDYGWLTFISAPLFWLLSVIHNFVGNWGWAIIILTFLIKLAFYPLSAASYKSMANMRRIAPRLQTLKERHKNDKQAFNQAMMEMYRTEKINPLGGCLPILIQIPVFIALYWVLLESVEMRHAPFALWIQDLSSRDPYFVLPIIMGISMYAQQKLNPAPMDPMQKKIMNFLPALFTVFFLFFPAGLVLYWVVNNLLSIAQQWKITRAIEAKAK